MFIMCYNLFKEEEIFMKKVISTIKNLYKNYREVANYLIFGILTTILNYIAYLLSAKVCNLSVVVSTSIAWFIAVTFAYLTNRKYVFNSNATTKMHIFKETVKFYAFRIISGIIEIVLMFLTVELMQLNDSVMKILMNFVVIVVNYIFSKTIIFKKDINEKEDLIENIGLETNKITNIFRTIVNSVMLFLSSYILYLVLETRSFMLLTIILILFKLTINLYIKYNSNNTIIKINKVFNKIFPYLLFGIALIIRILFYFKLQIIPRADFAALLNAANELLRGVNILNSEPYFIRWAYQTGMVLYNAVVIGLLGSDVWLHIFDCIYGSITCLFIYLIAKEMFSKKAAQIVSVLYCIGIYISAFCGVLSNQHIFSVFVLLAFYLLIAKKYNKMNWILKFSLIGLLLGLSNIFRSEAIVYIAAFAAYIFLKSLTKEKIKKGLISILIVIVAYFVVTTSASLLIKATNINKNGLENKDVLWKFVCGSDYSVGGGYSYVGSNYLSNPKAEKEYIINNLKSLTFDEYINFFEVKEREFWQKIPYYWVFYELENENVEVFGNLHPMEEVTYFIRIYDNTIFLFIMLCVFILIYKERLNKNNDRRIYLIYLALLANFFVYLLIEVNARYSYIAKILLYILAAGGIDIIYKTLKERKEQKVINNGQK